MGGYDTCGIPPEVELTHLDVFYLLPLVRLALKVSRASSGPILHKRYAAPALGRFGALQFEMWPRFCAMRSYQAGIRGARVIGIDLLACQVQGKGPVPRS